MRVDQARHDPLPAGIDHLDIAAVFELEIRRRCADALDRVALDHDRVVADGRLARAVDQRAVADDEGFFG
jgi:hypothetical protein